MCSRCLRGTLLRFGSFGRDLRHGSGGILAVCCAVRVGWVVWATGRCSGAVPAGTARPDIPADARVPAVTPGVWGMGTPVGGFGETCPTAVGGKPVGGQFSERAGQLVVGFGVVLGVIAYVRGAR